MTSPTNPVPSATVVVPTYKDGEHIVRALESVRRAAAYARERLGAFDFECVVVEDRSPDDSYERAKEYAANRPEFAVHRNETNRGAAYSRNRGARLGSGERVFFLDADDEFREDHLHLCLAAVAENPRIDYVKTDVALDVDIHPFWKDSILESVPFNVCVHRRAHDFLGGFPEHDLFRQFGGAEDTAYRSALSAFFVTTDDYIREETVIHHHYPGNSLDRQLHKFRLPPEEAKGTWTLTPEQVKIAPDVKRLQKEYRAKIERRLMDWVEFLGPKLRSEE
jgi:glycosyltransferase involved in cell wall biosynthesis